MMSHSGQNCRPPRDDGLTKYNLSHNLQVCIFAFTAFATSHCRLELHAKLQRCLRLPDRAAADNLFLSAQRTGAAAGKRIATDTRNMFRHLRLRL